MPPEDDYEDLDPIYSDEPYFSFEAEVQWLIQTSEYSTPAVKEAIVEQIELMRASKDKELKERASMRIEINERRAIRNLRQNDSTYVFRVKK